MRLYQQYKMHIITSRADGLLMYHIDIQSHCAGFSIRTIVNNVQRPEWTAAAVSIAVCPIIELCIKQLLPLLEIATLFCISKDSLCYDMRRAGTKLKKSLHFSLLLWTKWRPFRRRCFQIHFCESTVLYFGKKFTAVCSEGSNWQ